MPLYALLVLGLAVVFRPASADENPQSPVIFRLYSDFTCPFCFIAERSLVERLVREYDVVLDWRGFELHPEIPPGGLSLAEAFPERDPITAHARVKLFGRARGVDLPGLPARIPNTRKALAVAAYAKREGKLEAFRRAAMDAYWTGHRNLEDEQVLRSLARQSGLDPVEAVATMTDSAYRRQIDAVSDEASRLGVTGIPAFVFPGSAPIVGCQAWEVIETAARDAGAVRRLISLPAVGGPAPAPDRAPTAGPVIDPAAARDSATMPTAAPQIPAPLRP